MRLLVVLALVGALLVFVGLGCLLMQWQERDGARRDVERRRDLWRQR